MHSASGSEPSRSIRASSHCPNKASLDDSTVFPRGWWMSGSIRVYVYISWWMLVDGGWWRAKSWKEILLVICWSDLAVELQPLVCQDRTESGLRHPPPAPANVFSRWGRFRTTRLFPRSVYRRPVDGDDFEAVITNYTLATPCVDVKNFWKHGLLCAA